MNGLRYAEATVAALVGLWLVAGVLAHPTAFVALALLALLPLALVVAPLLVVLGVTERPASIRWSGRSGRLRADETADATVRARVRSRSP